MKTGTKLKLTDGRNAIVVHAYKSMDKVAVTIVGKDYKTTNIKMDLVPVGDIDEMETEHGTYKNLGTHVDEEDDTHLFCGQCEECNGEDPDRDVQRDLEEGWLADIAHNNGQ